MRSRETKVQGRRGVDQPRGVRSRSVDRCFASMVTELAIVIGLLNETGFL